MTLKSFGPILKAGSSISTKLAKYKEWVIINVEVYVIVEIFSDPGAFQFVAHKIEIDSINQSERKLIYQRLQAAKELHGLKHENILRYEGSFIKDRTLYILNAYALKGSILDVFDSYRGESFESLRHCNVILSNDAIVTLNFRFNYVINLTSASSILPLSNHSESAWSIRES